MTLSWLLFNLEPRTEVEFLWVYLEDHVRAFHNRNIRHSAAILLATNNSDSWIVFLRWCHCEEGLSRWCSDFLRPAGRNRVFSNFFIDITNSIYFKWCVRHCYWTCWCKNNCVKVLHTMGKSGKKNEKKGLSYLDINCSCPGKHISGKRWTLSQYL